jgi:hypothetical protein
MNLYRISRTQLTQFVPDSIAIPLVPLFAFRTVRRDTVAVDVWQLPYFGKRQTENFLLDSDGQLRKFNPRFIVGHIQFSLVSYTLSG